MRARHLAAALGAALLAGVVPDVARAGDPIMPLGELRPGMQCTGYSVIQGTQISAFDVQIVDVVSGDASANDGPRILIRVSGPAVDATGVGPGFSGSPIYCGGRNAGAISEAIGEYGGKTVLATPIEEILANPPDAPQGSPVARRSRIGRVLPLAEPLTVSGLNRGLARELTEAGDKASRKILAAPAAPLTPFPAAPPRPGSAMSVGYSSGELAVGAVGTVAYVDGNRVWGFGHPFENSGLRALLLQDAYVYTVISNPNAGDETGSTYKLAAAGHDLGTISNDATAAVVGRAGATPPTVPVRIFSDDEDTGEESVLGSRVVDETDAGTPTGGSALSFVAPLALAQGASAILRSAPRQAQRHRLHPDHAARAQAPAAAVQPVRVGDRAVGPRGGRQHRRRRRGLRRARRADRDRRLQAACAPRHRVRRARHAPPRAAPGLPAPRRAAAPRPPRPPRACPHAPAGRPRPADHPHLPPADPERPASRDPAADLLGRDVDDPDSDLFGALVETIIIGGDEEGDSTGREGPRSLDGLARRISDLQRYDGVRLRAGGVRTRAYRDRELRISGRVSTSVRVVRKRR